MNLEIQSDGEDALLCGWSTDGSVGFNTWHRSSEEAEAVAEEEYSVPRHLWEKT
ncbi:MAG: hypothetical protein Q8K78_01060 [Planctomycetaceae bacterium]|nr:hypothetical protein [Planctomycetaceae bacterium]